MIPSEGGVLAVDKPAGPTSHDMVARARKGLGTRRVGHTGTLDPFASGVLLLCVGPATRISSWLTAQSKSYRARARLGAITTTLDPEGEVVETRDGWQELSTAEIEEILRSFVGPQEQLPPAFSAKKVRGEAAYRRARRGEEVELAPVEVVVEELSLVSWAPPELTFDVRCSSGTYIRALARDLGDALDVGAYLTGLRRTAVGEITADRAVPGDRLDVVPDAAWIRPADALSGAGMPRLVVDAATVRGLSHGQKVPTEATLEGAVAVVDDGGALVAVAEIEGGRVHPRKVFVQP